MGTKKVWYVVQSKPQKENSVYSQLCANSIEAYYPTIWVNPVNPRSAKVRPFFPGYLFVQVDLDEIGVGTIQWIPGVKQLVEREGEPISIPNSIIDELKRWLTTINETGPLEISEFEKGPLTRITEGSLAGHDVLLDMQFSGPERVQVLLELATKS